MTSEYLPENPDKWSNSIESNYWGGFGTAFYVSKERCY